MCCNEDHLLRAYARNNLWVSVQGGQIWGLDAGTPRLAHRSRLRRLRLGHRREPVRVWRRHLRHAAWVLECLAPRDERCPHLEGRCFAQFNVPGPAPTPVPPQVMTLQPGCPGGRCRRPPRRGQRRFRGTGPDLGAHEHGAPPTAVRPRPALQPPLAPGALAATAVSSTRVDLRWADQSSSESGFRIERSAGGQSFAFLATVAPNVVTFSDVTVTAGLQYRLPGRRLQRGGTLCILECDLNHHVLRTHAVRRHRGSPARDDPGRELRRGRAGRRIRRHHHGQRRGAGPGPPTWTSRARRTRAAALTSGGPVQGSG